jgi:hypothetical protein
MKRFVHRAVPVLIVGTLVLLYFGASIKSRYEFQHFPSAIVQ